MNQELWNKIENFSFEDPLSEYGFASRLSFENFWTISYTQHAIDEYRKFMYLAAISDEMVTPSTDIDKVWHQHFIFTKSYHSFCEVLGKKIDHIPSRYNKKDEEKFRQTKVYTLELYNKEFGIKPSSIWNNNTMYDSLHLERSNRRLSTISTTICVVSILSIVPAYLLLKPIYVNINNPNFIYYYCICCVLSFVLLEVFNSIYLKKLFYRFDKNSFIYQLHPYELTFLKKQTNSSITIGKLNELLDEGSIVIGNENTIQTLKETSFEGKEYKLIVSTLKEFGPLNYSKFLHILHSKRIFWTIPNSMNALREYINHSTVFTKLFMINIIVLCIIVVLGITRLLIGISREVPVGILTILIVSMCIISSLFLYGLLFKFSKKVIPNFYKNFILPRIDYSNDWKWQYFLMGSVVLTSSLASAAEIDHKQVSGQGCSNSCSANCGSSCGGCGGD